MPVSRLKHLLVLLFAHLAWPLSTGSAQADTAWGNECDRLAGSREDKNLPRQFSSVRLKDIIVAEAEPACRAALVANPAEARFAYQLGRVLHKAERHAEAARFYRQAADLGYRRAMFNLGYQYEDGLGVSKDEGQAVRWYAKAADLGDPPAVAQLGYMYLNGRGVTRNDAEALRLFRKAAELGSAVAVTNLGYMSFHGFQVLKDAAEAVRLWRKAADLGEPNAMTYLGLAYRYGRGVAADEVTAKSWLDKATRIMGDAAATKRVAELRVSFETTADARPIWRYRCMYAFGTHTNDKSMTHMTCTSRAVDMVGDHCSPAPFAVLGCLQACTDPRAQCSEYASVDPGPFASDEINRELKARGGVAWSMGAILRDGRQIRCNVQYLLQRDGYSTSTSWSCHLTK